MAPASGEFLLRCSAPAPAARIGCRQVLHDWDDAQAATILRNIRRAIGSDVSASRCSAENNGLCSESSSAQRTQWSSASPELVVIDIVLPERGPPSLKEAISDLQVRLEGSTA